VPIDDEVASLEGTGDGSATSREQVAGVWVQMMVLLVASVLRS
jgi:hypothetical protein